MKKQSAVLLTFLVLAQLGTTYVIKEGNVEVGRYEEADGKNEIREISGSQPKPVEMKKETTVVYSDEGGYTAKLVETGRLVPDKKETWTIQGRALDFLSAKPLTQGTLRFLSLEEKNVEIKINWNGMFSGKIPKLDDKKSYQLVLEPPQGYTNRFLIYHSGQLAKIASAQRLARAQSLGLIPMVHISEHYVDLEIAVLPEAAMKRNR